MKSNLRYKILDQSLKIEHEIGKILSKIIRLNPSDSKTLGNKSTSISFKTKVDFLYDLKRISKDEYELLLLFMEIRNQLVHNYEVDTMEKVLQSISKKPLLLKLSAECSKSYQSSTTETDKEFWLDQLLNKLHIELLTILNNQSKLLIKDIEQEIENITNKRVVEAQEEMLKFIFKTQQEVLQELLETFLEGMEQKEEIKNTFDFAFHKIMEKKIEDHFGH